MRRYLYLLVILVFNSFPIVIAAQGPAAPVRTPAEIKAMPEGEEKIRQVVNLVRTHNLANSRELDELLASSLQTADSLKRNELKAALLISSAINECYRHNFASAEQRLDEAEKHADMLPPPLRSAVYMDMVFPNKVLLSRPEKVKQLLNTALEITKDQPSLVEHQIAAYSGLATFYLQYKQFALADSCYKKSLQLARELGNAQRHLSTRFAYFHGLVLANKMKQAFVMLNELLDEIKDTKGPMNRIMKADIAKCYTLMKNYREANGVLLSLLEDPDLARLPRNGFLFSLVKNSLLLKEPPTKIAQYLKEMENTVDFKLRAPDWQAYQVANGMYQLRTGDTTRGIQSLLSVANLGLAVPETFRYALEAHIYLGDVYSNRGINDSAYHYFGEAAKAVEQLRTHPRLSSVAYPELNGIYQNYVRKHNERQKQYKQLAQILQQELQIRESTQHDSLSMLAKEIETRLRVKDKEHALELTTKQHELDKLAFEKSREQSKYITLILAIVALCVTIVAIFIYQDRKHAGKLHDMEKEKLKKDHEVKVMTTLAQTQEAERSRIASDLHDELGGNLAAIKIAVQRLDASKDKLETVMQLIDLTSANVRNIAHNLMPPEFVKTSLETLLSQHFQLLNTKGNTNFNFHFSGKNGVFSKQDELMIYRIVIELTNNILKHAQASEATVQLVYHEKSLSIIAEDNGGGFAENTNEGMGLQNIRSRVNYFNGTLNIDSSVHGTTVVIQLPFSNTNQPI